MYNVQYTKPLTHNQMLKVIKKFANEYNAHIVLVESDFKISTQYHIKFADGSKIEIYDYKATNLYSDNLPSVEKFRKSKYEWHFKCSNLILQETFTKAINA